MNGNEDTLVPQAPVAPEPADLAEAFKMYNTPNPAPVEEPVVVPGGEQEPEPAAAAPVTDEQGDGAIDDGSADVIEPIDYNPAKQQLMQDIQNTALQNVRQKFKEQGIEMWSIEDVYERDERTGRVRFRNPDNPDRDFQSRYEAQQFIDAMNKQVLASFRNEVNKEQRALVEQEAPKLRLMEFAPIYDAMDKTAKDIFEDLVAPYVIRDKAGKEIGYNVNLPALAKQAEAIANRFRPQVPEEPAKATEEPAKEPSGPALDIKTGASETGEAEPKTLGEALKMFDKKQREKKGK